LAQVFSNSCIRWTHGGEVCQRWYMMTTTQEQLNEEVQALEQRLEEVTAEVQVKEEELIVWGERLQTIQRENEAKLRLVRSRAEGARVRAPGTSGGRTQGVDRLLGGGAFGQGALGHPRPSIAGAPNLSGISEGDEVESVSENGSPLRERGPLSSLGDPDGEGFEQDAGSFEDVEDDADGSGVFPQEHRDQDRLASEPEGVTAEAVAALTQEVNRELHGLRASWIDLLRELGRLKPVTSSRPQVIVQATVEPPVESLIPATVAVGSGATATASGSSGIYSPTGRAPTPLPDRISPWPTSHRLLTPVSVEGGRQRSCVTPTKVAPSGPTALPLSRVPPSVAAALAPASAGAGSCHAAAATGLLARATVPAASVSGGGGCSSAGSSLSFGASPVRTPTPSIQASVQPTMTHKVVYVGAPSPIAPMSTTRSATSLPTLGSMVVPSAAPTTTTTPFQLSGAQAGLPQPVLSGGSCSSGPRSPPTPVGSGWSGAARPVGTPHRMMPPGSSAWRREAWRA